MDKMKQNFQPFFMISQYLKQHNVFSKNSNNRTDTWPNVDIPKQRKIKFLSFNSSRKFKNSFLCFSDIIFH